MLAFWIVSFCFIALGWVIGFQHGYKEGRDDTAKRE